MSKQIDDILDESMTMEVNGKVFISQDHATRGYMRNEDLWCADLDLTGLSPWNSSGGHKKAGTLITPRHVIGAAHYEYSIGTVVRFVETNGTVHDRTVAGKTRHPDYKPHFPDLTIYTLDSDLPSSITPCTVMPSDYSKYFDNIYKSKIPCIGFDQEEKALIIDWANGGRMRTPTDSKRLIFNESKIKGDSGNPAFLVLEGKLVLITVWTYGGAGGGTAVADYISDINGMIATADKQAGVSTTYTVTEADFSLTQPVVTSSPSPSPTPSSSSVSCFSVTSCCPPSSCSIVTCCQSSSPSYVTCSNSSPSVCCSSPSPTPYSCCSSSCSTSCCSSPSSTPYNCCPSSSCSTVTSSPSPSSSSVSSCVPFTKDKVWVYTPPMTHPWPKFKYLEGDVPGNLTKTRTQGIDKSGKIYSLGYKTALVLETDTKKDTIVRKPCDEMGFIGTVDAKNGYTYYLPAYSTFIPKLNRETGELTFDKKFTGTPQIRSGAEGKNGIIYMPTYTRTLKIVTLDTKTGEVNTITPEKPSRNGITGCNHIWGAATDKKGEIYMPQVLGTSVAKIDKNGIFKYLDGPPVTSGVSGWTHKYIGAIYVKAVDKVFCLPRQGKRILVINCEDDSYVELNLPEDYLKVAHKSKNFYGYLAPDGWVYSTFWADTICFRINPKTNEIQWRDYKDEFMDGHLTVKAGSGIMSLGTGYSTSALVKGKNAFLGLAGTTRAIKLEFK